MTIHIQTAPFPDQLEQLVDRCRYRPGWRIRLIADFPRDHDASGDVTSRGLTLVITTRGYDSYHPEQGERYGVNHYFAVPPSTYDERSWQRWLFERFLEVERHEAMEFFKIGGERPYAPSHGPGNDPYMVREVGTVLDQKTRFTGEVNP